MLRSSTVLPFLLLLTACPGPGLDTTGDSADSTSTDGQSETSAEGSTAIMTTTGSPEPTTGDTSTTEVCIGLLDQPVSETCKAWPWGNQDCSSRQHPLPLCDEVIATLAKTPACASIDLCMYEACAVALQGAPCGTRPAECEPIVDCIGEQPPHATCCDENGFGAQPGLCGVSSESFCLDCDWKPVLCMTQGCGSANADDCCLSQDGETIACPVLGCSPDFCDNFEAVALESGLGAELAAALGEACPLDRCLACAEVTKVCAGSACPALVAKCEAEMKTCDCG